MEIRCSFDVTSERLTYTGTERSSWLRFRTERHFFLIWVSGCVRASVRRIVRNLHRVGYGKTGVGGCVHSKNASIRRIVNRWHRVVWRLLTGTVRLWARPFEELFKAGIAFSGCYRIRTSVRNDKHSSRQQQAVSYGRRQRQTVAGSNSSWWSVLPTKRSSSYEQACNTTPSFGGAERHWIICVWSQHTLTVPVPGTCRYWWLVAVGQLHGDSLITQSLPFSMFHSIAMQPRSNKHIFGTCFKVEAWPLSRC